MKRLDTSPISSTNEFPVKAGTLEFIQDSYKEQIANLFTSLVEIPLTDTVYIISGCKNTGSGANYIISAGVLYINGEIYNFDGATFTLSGLQKAYARIQITQFTTNADPVTFTDGIARNVHNIRKIVIENTITSSGLPEFKDFVHVGSWLKGDTKEVVCDSTYLSNNFDSTGLGKNERVGWAIMNGNNGTQNDNGKTVIAYGVDYTTLGATGGSKDSTLIEHDHNFDDYFLIQDGTGATIPFATGQIAISTQDGTAGDSNNNAVFYKTHKTEKAGTTGDTGVNKNMQPYVVRLRIQKI